ncbi:hypothetical protein RYX36_035701 [Vicia faba]
MYCIEFYSKNIMGTVQGVAFVIDGCALEIALKHYCKAFTELAILSRTGMIQHADIYIGISIQEGLRAARLADL